jgi:hypothetical protein
MLQGDTKREQERYPKNVLRALGSQLGKILATLPDELENRLREHLRKQGDLSRIVGDALESRLDRIEKKSKK